MSAINSSQHAVYPTISDNGRFVAYQGAHPSQGFASTVYVSDRQNLAVPERIGTDCTFGADCELLRPRLSGNAQFVLFHSREGFNLPVGVGDANEFDNDVFRWDRQTSTSLRISLGVGGVEPDGDSYAGDISRDGRYVVFESEATNLVTAPSLVGAPTRIRTYWKDLQSGEVKLVYRGTATEAREDSHFGPRITSNGRYVLVVTEVQGGGGYTEIIHWDALTGTTGSGEFLGVSGDRYAMTPDRRYLAYAHIPPALPKGNQPIGSAVARVYRILGQQQSEYVYGGAFAFGALYGIGLSAGAGYLAVDGAELFGPHEVDFYTRDYGRAIVRLDNVINGGAGGFDLTPDGQYAVVSAFDLQRAPFLNDNDDKADIFFIRNRLWKPGPTNLLADFPSIPANSRNVKVSTDGSIGVFESEIPASEFGAYTDTNGTTDVFRYLADFQQIELLSTENGTAAFAGGARNPAMSANGGEVVFEAPDIGITAKNVQPGGGLSKPMLVKTSSTSIFLRRLVQNTPQRVSTSRTGGAANGNSANPTISPDGRWVGFATDANNVNPGSDTNAVRDVVAVNLETGQRHCVSTCAAVVADGPSDHPSISNNGQVAFETASSVTQKAAGLSKGVANFQILLRNLIQNTSQVISRGPSGQPGDGPSMFPSISSSGTVVAYQSTASNLDASGSDGRANVFRYTVVSGSQRVSRRTPPPGGKTTVAVDGDSLRPSVSGDGRFIAFQTAATNLDDADVNGVVDLVVYDGRKGGLRRLSEGFGGAESNGASETPHLNHNGTAVGFHSFASNLTDESDSETASSTSAPYERDNPLAASIVFADAFE